ncbi:WecB/TagA/CpsF family glycosyltransferase [Caldicellulosiruptoraceae bacterium PP1]
MEKYKILQTEINFFSWHELLKVIENNLQNLKGKYICICSVHPTVIAYENQYYRNVQNNAIYRLPDGMPLVYIAKKNKINSERITGPDLMSKIFEISDKAGYTHYFYGSTNEILNSMKNNLLKIYPNLKILGMYSPPFRKLSYKEDVDIIKEINKLNPDFVWIGLGVPKQEIWMYEHKDKINSLMIGVGAGFDYFAGRIKRAPKWMQKVCLEWLFRLIQEPRRLWKRYVITNAKFLLYLALTDKKY